MVNLARAWRPVPGHAVGCENPVPERVGDADPKGSRRKRHRTEKLRCHFRIGRSRRDDQVRQVVGAGRRSQRDHAQRDVNYMLPPPCISPNTGRESTMPESPASLAGSWSRDGQLTKIDGLWEENWRQRAAGRGHPRCRAAAIRALWGGGSGNCTGVYVMVDEFLARASACHLQSTSRLPASSLRSPRSLCDARRRLC